LTYQPIFPAGETAVYFGLLGPNWYHQR